jgi:ABC-type transporter Mla subunit MlaD
MEEQFQEIQNGLAAIVEIQRMNSETLSQLNQRVSKIIDSSDARMKRIEQNLDALIRAITAEHSNWKQ